MYLFCKVSLLYFFIHRQFFIAFFGEFYAKTFTPHFSFVTSAARMYAKYSRIVIVLFEHRYLCKSSYPKPPHPAAGKVQFFVIFMLLSRLVSIVRISNIRSLKLHVKLCVIEFFFSFFLDCSGSVAVQLPFPCVSCQFSSILILSCMLSVLTFIPDVNIWELSVQRIT